MPPHWPADRDSPGRWSERPRDGDNSVAWLVWHMARWHDIAVNVLVRDVDPVLDDAWQRAIDVGVAPGTGFTSEEVDEFSQRVDPTALDKYWAAVLDRTTDWLTSIDDQELDDLMTRVIDTDSRYRDSKVSLLVPASEWVRDWHRGHPGAWHLRWVVVGHTYWHFGEMQSVCTALGHPNM